MVRVKLAVLASCLLGTLVSGCSHAEPAAKDFTLVDQRPAKAQETGNTLEAAEQACKEETRRRASPRSSPSFPGCARDLPTRTISPA
jgi:hypothetical protein